MASERIISGIKISYTEKIENDTDPLFVFLHGWGSSSIAFFPFFEHVDNAVTFDFPPFGNSGKFCSAFTLSDYANLTEKFLEKYDQNFVFVVHSFGGRILLKLLQNKQITEKTEKIIAIGVPFFRFQSIKHRMIEKTAKIFQHPCLQWMKPLAKKILYTFWKNSDYAALGENEIMKQTFQNIISEPLEPYFPVLLHKKIFLLWGEKDDAAPFENTKKMKEILPHIQIFSWKNARHFPFVEVKKDFFEVFTKIKNSENTF